MKKNKEEKIKKHSLHIVLTILVALPIFSLILFFIVDKTSLTRSFDYFFYTLINGLYPIYWLDILIYPFHRNFLPWGAGFLPSYFYFMIGPFLIYMFIKDRKLFPWILFSIVVGTLMGMLLYGLSQHFIFRQRPFTVFPHNMDKETMEGLKSWPSFPSGHVRDTALYSTIIASYIPRLMWPLGIFTLFIAFSRLYTGAHYPSDVVAGMIIGYVLARTVLMMARELQIIFENRTVFIHGSKPKSKQ
ncbi:MAG TPA: phosphatase PAP2 family protein [Candidatus Nitrosocosmicus sp.]|nr:phosphatase PAP2 family protein [Candidatus Nitrosocosmicus sp.]